MTTAKELLEQATPLPWTVYDAPRPGIDSRDRNVIYASTFTADYGGVGRKEDATLIVYAVNRLPDYEAAVDALERLIAANEGLELNGAEDAIEALARLRGES